MPTIQSAEQRYNRLHLICRCCYQLVVGRVALSGGFENALREIRFCGRSRIFHRHIFHDIFKRIPHYLRDFRVEDHSIIPFRCRPLNLAQMTHSLQFAMEHIGPTLRGDDQNIKDDLFRTPVCLRTGEITAPSGGR
jgi:hypothetical protein